MSVRVPALRSLRTLQQASKTTKWTASSASSFSWRVIAVRRSDWSHRMGSSDDFPSRLGRGRVHRSRAPIWGGACQTLVLQIDKSFLLKL